MDLTGYVDLFIAEAQQYLRVLDGALLSLEATADAAALEEAFRAVHTVKGMAAVMGYAEVARRAHEMEDRLAAIRGDESRPDAAVVDSLLADADALEHAIEEAVAVAVPAEVSDEDAAAPPSPAPGGAVAAAAPAGLGRLEPDAGAGWPEGTAAVLRVTLHPHAAMKAARALLLVRQVSGLAAVLRTEPAEFDEAFDGVVRIALGADAEPSALQAALASYDDVESIVIETPAEAEAGPAEPGSGRRARRHVRVDQRRLDEVVDSVGELGALRARLGAMALAGDWAGLTEMLERFVRLAGELQDAVLQVRMVPVREVFGRFPRLVRDMARGLGKEVEFRMEGVDVEVDRSVLEAIADPLVHLLRNAVDHGIEAPEQRLAAGKARRGTLELRVERERSGVQIRVHDDGRGVPRRRVLALARRLGVDDADGTALTDQELLKLMSRPGLSTARTVTQLSGRGVGLDAVTTTVRRLGGAIELSTEEDSGTTFLLRLPVTLAVVQALWIRVCGEDYAVPLTHVSEVVELDGARSERGSKGDSLELRGESYPLVRLRAVLDVDGDGAERAALLAETGTRRAALAVDELVGREQIVVKGFDAAAGTLPLFSGATILPDGRPALVLDPISVL